MDFGNKLLSEMLFRNWQSQQFEYYISMLELVVEDDVASVKEEFQQYMQDAASENP